MNNSNCIALDSFLMQIPLDKVKIIDQTIIDTHQLINIETSEIVKEYQAAKKDSINIAELRNEPFSIYLKIVKQNRLNGNKGMETKEYLSLTINSKLLKEQYLQGINKDTVKALYDNLMALNVFYVEYKCFLNSPISDIDYKYDIVLEKKAIKPYLTDLNKKIKPEYKLCTTLHNRKDNQGLQVGKRGDKQTMFIKWYNKTKELIHNSYLFNDRYSKVYDTTDTNIIRFEFTFMGKNDLLRVGLIEEKQLATLEYAINIEQHKLQMVMNNLINDRFALEIVLTVEDFTPPKTKGKLSQANVDLLYKLLINFMIQKVLNDTMAHTLIDSVANPKIGVETMDNGSLERKYKEGLKVYEQAKQDFSDKLIIYKHSNLLLQLLNN